MNKRPIKIATAQSFISPDVRKNGREIRRLRQQARSAGATLVHLRRSCAFLPQAESNKTESMNAIEQQNEFRSWSVLPARLDVCQTAWFLGFKPHDIPLLTAAGLLKPLGHPAAPFAGSFAGSSLRSFTTS